MAEQLTFDLPAREALGRDAFFVSPSNQIAVATLDAPDLWPSRKLALVGPKGAGKTHLAHVVATEAEASLIDASTLNDIEIPTLATRAIVIVENADLIPLLPNARTAEEALFHLHNLTLSEGGRLLLTATSAPNHWNLTLPDLASRMTATSVVRIEEPDDTLLAALLVKQFDDRQITISPNLIPYLIKRIDRSAASVGALVETLDKLSLRTGKPVSQKLAAHVLDIRRD